MARQYSLLREFGSLHRNLVSWANTPGREQADHSARVDESGRDQAGREVKHIRKEIDNQGSRRNQTRRKKGDKE